MTATDTPNVIFNDKCILSKLDSDSTIILGECLLFQF